MDREVVSLHHSTVFLNARQGATLALSENAGLRGWGARIQDTMLHLAAARRRRIGLEEFGELVAEEEGREAPYTKGAVSGWTKEKYEPGIATFEAMARLVGCDPWWIVWGVGRPPTNVVHPQPVEAPPARRREAR